MSNVKISDWNYSAWGEILKSEEMGQICDELAEDIASKCGDGYGHEKVLMGTRYIGSVFTETQEAARDNQTNNTILRAMGTDS